MLAIEVQTENGERHLRVTAEELAALVRRIGGPGDRFLVVERISGPAEVFVQVWHEAGGDYTLEHREGSNDRHFRVLLDDPGPVIAAMTGWARRADGWDAGLAWQRLDLTPEPETPAPPLELPDDDRRQLEDRLRQSLAGGYATRAELAELAEDYLVKGDRRPVSPAQARALVDRMWRERAEEQAGWEGETDADRLTRAFTALEAAGITARENFTCCHSCGQAEIAGVGSPDARGFVYFHSQSTDAAAAGHGLSLDYGGFDDSAETTAAVGREVVAALAVAGLPADWDGDPASAVEVRPLDWRRRLVG
ncbi:DUF6891 domain-containing protein [Kitasatospora sp. NPDC086009]|uniref:DUF6891 domain-containing protein n=1 Tax=unclassified Kitasatospora TaxID=2633591 RepID=UPI0037C4FAFE